MLNRNSRSELRVEEVGRGDDDHAEQDQRDDVEHRSGRPACRAGPGTSRASARCAARAPSRWRARRGEPAASPTSAPRPSSPRRRRGGAAGRRGSAARAIAYQALARRNIEAIIRPVATSTQADVGADDAGRPPGRRRSAARRWRSARRRAIAATPRPTRRAVRWRPTRARGSGRARAGAGPGPAGGRRPASKPVAAGDALAGALAGSGTDDRALVDGLDLRGDVRPGVALRRLARRPAHPRAAGRARGSAPAAPRRGAAGRRAGPGRRRAPSLTTSA